MRCRRPTLFGLVVVTLSALTLSSCVDGTHPHQAIVVGESAQKSMIYDHWTCLSSADYGLYYSCTYNGYTVVGADPDPFTFQTDASTAVFNSPVDCGGSPSACGAGGGAPDGSGPLGYDPLASHDLEPCDPRYDTNCEKNPVPDYMKDKIRAALTYQVRPLTTVQDTARRARCQAMLNKFNAMLDNPVPQVFIGDTDAPISGQPHGGAYNPETGNIHFDPTPMNNLVIGGPSSNAGWLAAMTAMHEAAHAITGANHVAGSVTFSKAHGGAPIYGAGESVYFTDLNYGPNSCMK